MEGIGPVDRRADPGGADHPRNPSVDPIAAAYHCLTSGDAEVALDAAAATLGARRVSSQAHRLHHHPGRSITRTDRAVLVRATSRHEVDASGEAILVAHAHHRPVPEPVEHLEVAGARLAVWAYPNDPYLPGLRLAADPAWVASHLREAGVPIDGLALIRRAYRPTRGAVVEARIESGAASRAVAFLKVVRPGRLPGVVRTHTTLLAGSLPVPLVLGHSDDVAILTALPGIPLRRALRRNQPLPHPDDLVALSMRIAASEAETGRDPRRRADPSAHAARLRDRFPDLAAPIDAIVVAANRGKQRLVTVHGDLHGGQVLTTDGEVTGLLDLDGVGRGSLADDAANLVTHLAAQGDHRPAATNRAARYAAEVLAAYRKVVDPEALPPAVAGAWLSLATVALRANDEPLLRERVARAIRAGAGGTGMAHTGNPTG